MTTPTFKAGLEDVVVSTSEICFIDGEQGRLLYRGYDIHDLVARSTFEEVVYLLWHGALPTRKELGGFVKELAAHRRLSPKIIATLRGFPGKGAPMEVLRTGVSLLGMFDREHDDHSREASLRKALRLTAQIPTLVAAWARIRKGKEPVASSPRLGHAANFLWMLFGKRPTELSAKAFDSCLILHADHEFNASTFAARITASTLSDMYSAVTSAIGTLRGPLHGGANEQVIRMLLEIGDPARAEGWVRQALDQKQRIMGFGHRVYHTEDPRATHLRRLSEALGRQAGDLTWYEISRVIEREMQAEKGLYPNVDFYSASTYHAMGIEADLFTPIFAMSRVSGWTAHILEQQAHNRLIRPRAEYTGPTRATYVPIDRR